MMKNTKERIQEEALFLFSKRGYMGTSMNDIAKRIGVTKAALYKHYTSKQEILDSIIEKMDELDQQRSHDYKMPEGDMENIVEGYKHTAFDKIKSYTKAQFDHWTKETFSSRFRKMLTLEQYNTPEMGELYAHYLVKDPVSYIEKIFLGIVNNQVQAKLLSLEFYGPLFLLYSLYDEGRSEEYIYEMLEKHCDLFERNLRHG